MPYGLGTVWNNTSKYIYTDPDANKKVGIGTISPICALDVYSNIAEDGILLEKKYTLKPENNKKYDLIVRENIINTDLNDSLIISYQFNKESFDCNLSPFSYGTLTTIGTREKLQTEYYVGTGSAQINDNLYYNIEMNYSQFNSNKYTFCFWIFLNEECETNKYILYTEDANTNIPRFSLKYNANKNLAFITSDNSDDITVNKVINTNIWYHIAIIIDNTTNYDKYLQININGVEYIKNKDQDIDFIGAGKSDDANIYLGYKDNRINGYIDDFRIYKDTLTTDEINSNIIGKITKITPGNISANGNYGIDIINYCNLVNVGSESNNVDLAVYGNLKVTSNLKVDTLTLNETLISELYSSNLTVYSNATVHYDLTVHNDITENQRKLSDKYALIGSINKHTDVIISKMIDKDDVRTLYDKMPDFFRSNLIIAYDFDFNKDDLDDTKYFFSNNASTLNTNTDEIYTTFHTFNVTPHKHKNPVDYYGNKYVKGNSSLKCGSNIDGTLDYYSFYIDKINTDATFNASENYTLTFWVRFTKLGQQQQIFKFGDIAAYINLYLTESDTLDFKTTFNTTTSNITHTSTTINKDEWYHISILLKNHKTIDHIPKYAEDAEDATKLINSFTDLRYTDITTSGDTYYSFDTVDKISEVFIYINGIHVIDKRFDKNRTIFDSTKNANSNYLGSFNDTYTDVLHGYIDDFKMYNCIIPISYINTNIIGNALVIKPGQLSAIGNYGINIKNFTNEVTVGNETNEVNLSIYGLLAINYHTIKLSNIDIDIDNNTIATSNLLISDTLHTNCNIASNIQIINSIYGPGFTLDSNDKYINTIKITNITNNSNITSSNITVDTITVNSNLVLDNSIITKFNVTNINIDKIVKSSNNYITVYSNLIIGDDTSNVKRYDFSEGIIYDKIARINAASIDTTPTFSEYKSVYPAHPLKTIPQTSNVAIYDKPFIFYGIDNSPDIHMKNAYIREDNCNITGEIGKSYKGGSDRNRTRIKTDVGNIKIRNGYIEIYDCNLLDNTTTSTLKLQEDDINIINNSFDLKLNSNGYYFSNYHYNTTLNDTLTISNLDGKYSKLTYSNFLFDNDNGFTDSNTLTINTIVIKEKLKIPTITTDNIVSDKLSINTSNSSNPFGRIQAFLCRDSKIDINYEIKTNSNLKANEGIFNSITTSNIICSSNLEIGNTHISSNDVIVTNLVVKGSITLGSEQSSGNNNIDGGSGTLQIETIKTTNRDTSIFSIDTLKGSNLGKIRGFLSSNSKIDIDCNITTKATIYTLDLITSNILSASNLQGLGETRCKIRGHLTDDSIIDVNCNISTTGTIYTSDLITSNILRTSNLQGLDDTLCRIRGHLTDDSIITTTGDIITTGTISTSNLITSNITSPDGETLTITGTVNIPTLQSANLNVTNITEDVTIKKLLKTTGSGIATLESNVIKCYANTTQNSYMKMDGNGLYSKNASGAESNIIYYDNSTGVSKLKVKCQLLEVESFNVGDGSMFSFPNIISYEKNTVINIPNVYIGNDKDNTTIDKTKDVLFVDTPDETRLRTGNLLVENILNIGSGTEFLKIKTDKLATYSQVTNSIVQGPFTSFTDTNGKTIISLSHTNNSVGINIVPPSSASDTDIKLYVKGGIQTSGDIIAFINLSDSRFKTNIVSFTDKDIDVVNKLNPVRFKWIPDLFNSNMANKNDIGFIAQEVKEVIPEAVSTCKIELNDIDYHYINYERIIPYLVNNIKYLNNKIVELENKLNGL
tara:strand:- start:1215 stop:6443 length:5229 start_codon:yes stop_codon:yes gene_type:complete